MFLFELNWTFSSKLMASLSEAAWKVGHFWNTFMCKNTHCAIFNKFLENIFGQNNCNFWSILFDII